MRSKNTGYWVSNRTSNTYQMLRMVEITTNDSIDAGTSTITIADVKVWAVILTTACHIGILPCHFQRRRRTMKLPCANVKFAVISPQHFPRLRWFTICSYLHNTVEEEGLEAHTG